MLYKESRTNFIIISETKAEKFKESLISYMNHLNIVVLKELHTDNPSNVDIINQIPSITNPNEVTIFLLYSNPDIITSFLTNTEIVALKNNGVKIISFGCIDEFTTLLNKAVYENTYTVNGYFKSLQDPSDTFVIDNDVYFMSYILLLYNRYLMLKYLDNSFCDNNIIDSELFIGLTINEFNIIYNKIQYTMSESNIIQRTMYLGKIDSNGNIIDVIDLYSNTNDNSPYTLFTDTNVTICRDSELVIVDDNNSVVKIGFISSLMFENKYVYEIYRGFIYSFNNYQQIVYIKYIYILFY